MATTSPGNGGIAEMFNTFPFATDQEYQTGLHSILESGAFSNKSNEEKEATLSSRFAPPYHLIPISHYAKPPRVTGNSITLEDALSFESSTRLVDSNHLAEPQQQPQAVAEEVHTLSFAELKALIEQGKTDGIPNNKLIPNVLNDAPPNDNTGQIRRKPWET